MAWTQTALRVLLLLITLVTLLSQLVPRHQWPLDEPGPAEEAMDGGSGDPEAGSDSPESYMTFDLFWELPAQGTDVSEASPAGQKNETGLGNISWPLMEQPEFLTLLKERLSGTSGSEHRGWGAELSDSHEEGRSGIQLGSHFVSEALEPEPVDKELPEAVPGPEGNSEALEPAGVDERLSRAEDPRTEPSPVEGTADTGTAGAELTWCIIVRAFFMLSAICVLVTLMLFKVTLALGKCFKKCLRPSSEVPADKELVVEV